MKGSYLSWDYVFFSSCRFTDSLAPIASMENSSTYCSNMFPIHHDYITYTSTMVGCHPKHIAVPKRDPISETENANGTSRLCVSEVMNSPIILWQGDRIPRASSSSTITPTCIVFVYFAGRNRLKLASLCLSLEKPTAGAFFVPNPSWGRMVHSGFSGVSVGIVKLSWQQELRVF